ncbi:MAG: YqaE/Pmp3 family membrane protein [Treponema sp.]|nr:YqaE/Pmp3 family membrane protein [Treponema sp.]
MGCLRAILCIICPPLAVLDCGCGAILLTIILTCIGWVPGVIAAILFNTRK